MARLLEAKPIAERIKTEIKRQIESLGRAPVLLSVQVGEDAGAVSYVKSQQKVAEGLGIEYRFHKLPAEITERELLEFVRRMNSDKSLDGIIMQMPLPPLIDHKKISQAILAEKDVEGMHPENIGRILFGRASIIPCTAAAVMELLKESGVDLYGREAVVVGHSEIVGKPLSLLLLDKFATVTVCHIGTSKAAKLQEHVRAAEVLIVAVGKPGLIKGEWIREGAVVIDVGINRVGDKIVGDVEFQEAQRRAAFITPVPGGVGPLTVTLLMRNLLEAAKSK
ncbi:MAG: bifunctional 5,10-methylenetetrahydrofolate dehydrogenase/5,10-methenyltetrahydrofolate cyclohydrolase [Candidatus Omnitrophota bacterium]